MTPSKERFVAEISTYLYGNPDALDPAAALADVGVDSLDMIEVLMMAETKWNVAVTEGALAKLIEAPSLEDWYRVLIET